MTTSHPLNLQRIRSALASHVPRRLEAKKTTRLAAVAAILRDGSPSPELLFIHRAEDPNDPWSGHMAFPGGRVEADDSSPLATAIRETQEELALDLEHHATPLGRLSDVSAMARGRRLDMVIVPFVFEIVELRTVRPNHEVQDVVWVPLAFLADPGNRSTTPWRRHGVSLTLPCYRYQGHLIWGLTLGMVDELMTSVMGSLLE